MYEDFMPPEHLTAKAMEALRNAGQECSGVVWNGILVDYHRLFTDCMPAETRARFHRARVIDGDTLERDGEVFRIANIDAPETTRAKCESERVLGLRAKEELERLILYSQVSRKGKDKYGRTLALFRDTIIEYDIGLSMIEAGLAVAYDGGKRTGWCAPLKQ